MRVVVKYLNTGKALLSFEAAGDAYSWIDHVSSVTGVPTSKFIVELKK